MSQSTHGKRVVPVGGPQAEDKPSLRSGVGGCTRIFFKIVLWVTLLSVAGCIGFVIGTNYEDAPLEVPAEQREAVTAATAITTPTSTPEPTAVPKATGKTLNDAVPVGGEAVAPNGVVLQVIDAIPNATQIVAQANFLNATPTPGKRHYIVAVRIRNGSKETLTFSQIDFSLIGDRRAIYHDIFGCGVIPNALDAEVFPDGNAEGNVCFTVPEDEGRFVLMYDPDLFGDSNRAFLQVE